MSPAEVLGLIPWLPEGSAYYASLRGGVEHRAWPLPTVLAAGQLHALNGANWQRGGGKGNAPEPIKMPAIRSGAAKAGKSGVRVAGATARRMAAMKATQAAGDVPPPQAPPPGDDTD